MNSIHFEGTDFVLEASDLTENLREDLIDCGGSGDAEPAVDYVLSSYTITGDESDCKAYLKGYGAWEDSELQDHDENLKRLVWIAGCDLSENGEIYFNTYG